MFELAEEAVDQIALAVDAPVVGAMDRAVAGRWDASLGTARRELGEQDIGIVTTVGDDVTAPEADQKLWRRPQIVGLARGQREADRQAVLVDDGVDLGARSATRMADGVMFGSFLASAARWWMRTIEPSISAIEQGDPLRST